MALQRLNVRTKKSFPGLYFFDNSEAPPAKNTAVHIESSPRSDLTQTTEECDLEDFGAKLERCKAKDSPGKNSPSKHKKLFGSLRSLRSLTNLHSSPTKTKAKQPMTLRSESPVRHLDVCTTPLPVWHSLAILNFEQSPSDKPMFDLTMHHRSLSGSSLEVHHSSPMTVPGSARQGTPYNVFLPITDLPAGTIPDTPGPMQRAFNRDPANQLTCRSVSLTPFERYAPLTPVLTPLPGTNLSIGDTDPELVPLPPSANPSTVQLGGSAPGYFDISVDEHPQIDDTDVLNGLACLQLAEDCKSASSDHHGTSPHGLSAYSSVGRRGTGEEMRHQFEDPKPQDTVDTLGITQDRTQAHKRQQQARDLQETTQTPGVPQHHQVLPLRLEHQGGSLQDSFRRDSRNSEGFETCSGERSTATASEDSLHYRNSHQTCTSRSSSVYSDAQPPAIGKGSDHGDDAPPEFAYVVWDSPSEASAPKNIWGGTTSLYDGTGYGDDSGPSTPHEPNEGIHDIHLETSSAPLSVDGARSGNEMSNRPSSGEQPHHEPVRQFSLTAHGHGNGESLESIYRAYAYPLEDRTPSSSNCSAGGDVQRPATKKDEISS